MEYFVVVLVSTFKNKNSLRTIEVEISQKIKSVARSKFTGSYKTKRVLQGQIRERFPHFVDIFGRFFEKHSEKTSFGAQMAFLTFSQISGSTLGRGIKRHDCLKKSRKKSRINFSPRGKLRRLIYVETENKSL